MVRVAGRLEELLDEDGLSYLDAKPRFFPKLTQKAVPKGVVRALETTTRGNEVGLTTR